MKICICTTPIRPVPTYFPPFGSLAIIQALRRIGERALFLNIDFHRYTEAEIEDYFSRNQFDIVGVSAVVSTAYAYTKFLTDLIRRVSPQATIIIGGNMAASAEILLRKCEVDWCVVGDGEVIIQELVTALREHGPDLEKIRAIKGLCFLEKDGSFNFTGYGQKPTASEIEDPDYSILENDGSIDHYIPEVVDDRFGLLRGERFGGGRAAVVTMTKGCVSRCTFCHRWEKGYRALPLANIVEHLRLLKERYQIRCIDIADENFGSDREQADALAVEMNKLGLLWRAGGVRSSTVSPEQLKHWKDNGCFSVAYGTESGSQTILDIMEKKISVEQNHNALRWTYEAGLKSVIQMVLGMPGETDQTVRETIEFLKVAANYLDLGDDYPSSMISLNYAQALPGTPLYEYQRQHGFIGLTVDEEERYLLKISDTDAYSEDHFINCTGLPLLKVLMWQQQILAEVDAHYLQQKYNARYSMYRVVEFYFQLIGSRIVAKLARFVPARKFLAPQGTSHGAGDFVRKSGFYNIREAGKFTPLLLNPLTKCMFNPLLALGMAFGRTRGQSGFGLIFGYLTWVIKHAGRPSPPLDLPKVSLRKVVKIHSSMPDSGQDKMIPLRSGR